MNRLAKSLNLTASALLAALAVGTTVEAALVAYDPFLIGSNRAAGEYTAATDIRTMGAAALGWAGTPDGFGVAHAGSTANFQPNATGEDSAAVSYEQGGRLQWLGGTTVFNRNITRQLKPTASSSEWYFSIMTNRLNWAAAADNTYAVAGFTNAGGAGLQVGYEDQLKDGNADLVLRMGGTNRLLAANVPSNDNQLVLVKLQINQSGNDTVSVWVDPANVLSAPTLVFSDTNVSDSLTPFTQSKYESPGRSGVMYWDEIRLGTDFNSVTGVPEPTSLALMGLGGLLVARRRRG